MLPGCAKVTTYFNNGNHTTSHQYLKYKSDLTQFNFTIGGIKKISFLMGIFTTIKVTLEWTYLAT